MKSRCAPISLGTGMTARPLYLVEVTDPFIEPVCDGD
jgi:hypothetical protein